MGKTTIEWTEYSWNPIRARRKADGHTMKAGRTGWYCQKISPGCKRCYAESMNLRLGNGIGYAVPEIAEVELYLDEKALMEPMHWKTPKQVFVCSMTDLFADFVPDAWIDRIYAVEALTRHTYMHLTKRPARRLKYLTQEASEELQQDGRQLLVESAIENLLGRAIPGDFVRWPLPNVREGTSICTQKEADELVPIMLKTPAALRWLSMEPLLESVSLRWKNSTDFGTPHPRHKYPQPDERGRVTTNEYDGLRELDWIVVGGESGHGARPFNTDWALAIIEECRAAGVACFVKQLGAHVIQGGERRIKKDRKGGDMSEWPYEIRIRQFPEVHHA